MAYFGEYIKDKDHYSYIFSSRFQVEFCGAAKEDIHELEFTIHGDQNKPADRKGFGQYWGWLDIGDTEFCMIWPSYVQFAMCFHDGYEILESKGQGKAYRLNCKRKED
jgi:hypothetical protein